MLLCSFYVYRGRIVEFYAFDIGVLNVIFLLYCVLHFCVPMSLFVLLFYFIFCSFLFIFYTWAVFVCFFVPFCSSVYNFVFFFLVVDAIICIILILERDQWRQTLSRCQPYFLVLCCNRYVYEILVCCNFKSTTTYNFII